MPLPARRAGIGLLCAVPMPVAQKAFMSIHYDVLGRFNFHFSASANNGIFAAFCCPRR